MLCVFLLRIYFVHGAIDLTCNWLCLPFAYDFSREKKKKKKKSVVIQNNRNNLYQMTI